MFNDRKTPPQQPPMPRMAPPAPEPPIRQPSSAPPTTLLTVVGQQARLVGKFDITDSIQIECEIGGELSVGGKLVIGEKGVVNADVITVDAIIMGHYEGNMIATGDVEITETGRVTGNVQTDSLVIAKGGFFNGNVTKMSDSSRKVLPIEDRLEQASHAASH